MQCPCRSTVLPSDRQGKQQFVICQKCGGEFSTHQSSTPRLASKLVNGLLAIAPLASLAKHQARQMMIKRSESIGVPWRQKVAALRSYDLEAELDQVRDRDLEYPKYYLKPFHAYDAGNLSWEAATEVEVAAYAVHSRIWKDAGAQGDPRLRQSYHDVLTSLINPIPQDILDIGCSVGMSTFALQATYPQSRLTGLDLSPYFLSMARLSDAARPVTAAPSAIAWKHAAAEATGLPDSAFDLVSMSLVCHELPQSAILTILQEVRRLLRPGGYLAIMDMNPESEIYAKMPPYILTLLKSTEPYLDDYFSLDLAGAIAVSGFEPPTIICNTHRHRTVVAQVVA